jgi:hypothetical protein
MLLDLFSIRCRRRPLISRACQHGQPRIFGEMRISPRKLAQQENGAAAGVDTPRICAVAAQTRRLSAELYLSPRRRLHVASIAHSRRSHRANRQLSGLCASFSPRPSGAALWSQIPQTGAPTRECALPGASGWPPPEPILHRLRWLLPPRGYSSPR